MMSNEPPEKVFGAGTTTSFKRCLGGYMDRKCVKVYGSGKWDQLGAAAWSVCMNWSQGSLFYALCFRT